MERFTKEQFWKELEDAGEDVVRERVVTKLYGSGNKKLELAQEWLRIKEQKRVDDREEFELEKIQESIDIAKSAKNAAWVSAIAAALAFVISITSLLISLKVGG